MRINLMALGLACIASAFASVVNSQPSGPLISQELRQRILSRLSQHSSRAQLPTSVQEKAPNILYEDWLDPSRKRAVPVKIYLPPKGSGPYPVLIFSHGLGGSREAAGYLGHYLCEHGYVCIHLQHAGSDTSVVKAGLQKRAGKNGLMSTMRSAATWHNLQLRAADVSFVLDKLTELNNSPSSPLHGKLDLTRAAIAGHSFGAGTALAVSGQKYGIGSLQKSLRDNRLKAAIYLSPPVNLAGRSPGDIWGQVRIPGLLMTGTEDISPIGNTTAAERRLPFDGISAPRQYLVNFQGGDHMIFGGRKAGRPQDERFHEYINKVCLEFLDAYLKESVKAKEWLDGKESVSFISPAANYERK